MSKNKNKEDNQDDISEEEEVIFEEEGLEPTELIKKLRKRLKECESLKRDYLSGWQRSKADFLNLKGKIEQEKDDFLKFATEDIIVQLIPVLDSFELAFKKEPSEESQKTWKTGMENIYSQLKTVVLHNGVEEIEPESGTAFNPAEQEIISYEATSAEEGGMVMELVQKGYKLKGKVIRPAKVKISRLET
jgi:molecular chaperone GrpE